MPELTPELSFFSGGGEGLRGSTRRVVPRKPGPMTKEEVTMTITDDSELYALVEEIDERLERLVESRRRWAVEAAAVQALAAGRNRECA